MKREMNPKLLGAFVLSGIALFVALLMVFGVNQVFRERVPFVMFFDGSLNGLQIGAPVKFRGINVGRVTDIKVILSHRTKKIFMPVYIEITPDTVQEIDIDKKHPSRQVVLGMIKRGLRARLAVQSIVTGLLFIELDYEQDAKLRLVGKDLRFIEIPTVPSRTEELSSTLSTGREALESIRNFVQSPKLEEAIDDFSKMMRIGRDTMVDIQGAAGDAKTMMGTGDKAIKDAHIVIKDFKHHVDPLLVKLDNFMHEMEDSLSSVRVLAEYLSRHPEALVLGKGKAKRR